MTILGAGAQPAGSTFAGAGLYPTSTVSSGGTLIAPATAQQQTGRLINPQTGQYVFAANGMTAGMATVPQLVELAIADVDFSGIDVVTANMPAQVSARITAVLQPIVNQNLMTIVSINVVPLTNPSGQASGANSSVTWRDLTTGLTQTTAIGTP